MAEHSTGGYMRKFLFGLCAMTLVMSSAQAAAETLNNQMVIDLTKAGLGDEAIVAKIEETASNFDLSTTQMIDLKAKGISGAVIAAMIRSSNGSNEPDKEAFVNDSPDPMAPHHAGIYLLADGPARMIRIDPTVSSQTKTGGIFGYALTGGIASLSMKSVLPNATARIRANTSKPVFYFYFDETNAPYAQNADSGVWLSGPAATISSPNEFSLVRFQEKQNGRAARVASSAERRAGKERGSTCSSRW